MHSHKRSNSLKHCPMHLSYRHQCTAVSIRLALFLAGRGATSERLPRFSRHMNRVRATALSQHPCLGSLSLPRVVLGSYLFSSRRTFSGYVFVILSQAHTNRRLFKVLFSIRRVQFRLHMGISIRRKIMVRCTEVQSCGGHQNKRLTGCHRLFRNLKAAAVHHPGTVGDKQTNTLCPFVRFPMGLSKIKQPSSFDLLRVYGAV